MMKRFEGKVAAVTGGGSGIGLETAKRFVAEGGKVVINGRDEQKLTAAAQLIDPTGERVAVLPGSVEDPATGDAIVKMLVDEQDPFHVLFNNAGITRHSSMLETTEEDYDAVMEINVKGVYFTAQAVAKKMIEAGIKGSIIHTSSQMGHIGGIERAVYCTTKHGLEGLTKAMAIEFGPHGIRINTLSPTFIRTPLAELTLKDPEKRAWVLSKIKLGRLGELEDIMGPILFLASDASAMMTGTSLLIDGGWTAG